MVKLFNTKTRKIEEFKPLTDGKVGMYSCGPTVYSTPHIGNLRAYVFVDILRRTLEVNGYDVNHVMNITDVGHLFEEGEENRIGEDKLEYTAQTTGKTAWEIAEYYTKEFLEFLKDLNIKTPSVLCKATDHIEEMIQLIKKLEEKGFTYKIGDGIYFNTSKFPKYGELAGGKSDLRAGARVEMVPGKRSPTDFSLWKVTKSGVRRQMEWDSPWGKGFPGWHIECSAMSMKYLGGTIDIHTGGIDHIPVHHTNEIAQSETATGHEFVHFWLHNEFILVEGKKMSKSLGNVYTLHDIKEKSFLPIALRYLFLTAHYRDQFNFTWEGLKGAQTAYGRLVEAVGNLRGGNRNALSQEKSDLVEKYRNEFYHCMNNDLGTPAALAVVWEVLKSNMPSGDKYDLVVSFDEVLGLNLETMSKAKEAENVPQEVVDLSAERDRLRKDGMWDEADKIRGQIEDLGFVVEDRDGESVLRRKKALPDVQ